jgi:hydrogenase-4 component F
VNNIQLLGSITIGTPIAAALVIPLFPSDRTRRIIAVVAGVAPTCSGLVLCAISLIHATTPLDTGVIVLDPAGGILVGVDAVVGGAAVMASPGYLAGRVNQSGSRWYFSALFGFWAILLAVSLTGNLGAAWLLIEATTAASALLVAFSGKGRALEAAWKYLILTTLGLGVALMGILVLEAGDHAHGGLASLSWQHLVAPGMARSEVLVAYILLLGGLAAKVGWAPVHNWLPDAHAEAPPPVSALLSAALLPSVLLVAWRVEQALAPTIGWPEARRILIGFGLVSLAVAVPFLARPLPWKRLLAYSSLEHMGIIALGIGFGGSLALIGVAIHIAGHALAKGLGFLSAAPLQSAHPETSGHPTTGLGRTSPALAFPMGLSLAALMGIPPSPLFISELLILIGGFIAGDMVVAAIAALLISLCFLGLLHALLEMVLGKAHASHTQKPAGLRLVLAFSGAATAGLLVLTALSFVLVSSDVATALERGLM